MYSKIWECQRQRLEEHGFVFREEDPWKIRLFFSAILGKSFPDESLICFPRLISSLVLSVKRVSYCVFSSLKQENCLLYLVSLLDWTTAKGKWCPGVTNVLNRTFESTDTDRINREVCQNVWEKSDFPVKWALVLSKVAVAAAGLISNWISIWKAWYNSYSGSKIKDRWVRIKGTQGRHQEDLFLKKMKEKRDEMREQHITVASWSS